mmetsp:Transcript_25689/g.64719  ORF Transcript_25689/g.64719 Transcript_25689/m.64719 type:complete len:371 (+) Transcript_25689:671-1783(+)
MPVSAGVEAEWRLLLLRNLDRRGPPPGVSGVGPSGAARGGNCKFAAAVLFEGALPPPLDCTGGLPRPPERSKDGSLSFAGAGAASSSFVGDFGTSSSFLGDFGTPSLASLDLLFGGKVRYGTSFGLACSASKSAFCFCSCSCCSCNCRCCSSFFFFSFSSNSCASFCCSSWCLSCSRCCSSSCSCCSFWSSNCCRKCSCCCSMCSWSCRSIFTCMAACWSCSCSCSRCWSISSLSCARSLPGASTAAASFFGRASSKGGRSPTRLYFFDMGEGSDSWAIMASKHSSSSSLPPPSSPSPHGSHSSRYRFSKAAASARSAASFLEAFSADLTEVGLPGTTAASGAGAPSAAEAFGAGAAAAGSSSMAKRMLF